jgi:hypothetical protein
MSTQTNGHPAEDVLIEYAIEGIHAELSAHIDTCQSCGRYVADMQRLKKGVQDSDGEPMPGSARRKVIDIPKKQAIGYEILDLVKGWYRSPFVFIMGTLAFALFAFIYFVFILK